jgi:hypothetical protein
MEVTVLVLDSDSESSASMEMRESWVGQSDESRVCRRLRGLQGNNKAKQAGEEVSFVDIVRESGRYSIGLDRNREREETAKSWHHGLKTWGQSEVGSGWIAIYRVERRLLQAPIWRRSLFMLRAGSLRPELSAAACRFRLARFRKLTKVHCFWKETWFDFEHG